MEIGYILNELWRRKYWVALGLIVAVIAAASTAYKLPSLEKKSLVLGTASTEVLIDSPRSPLGSLTSEIDTLAVRAGIYARLIESTPVRERVARELGVSPLGVATQGPQPKRSQRGREASAGDRSNELLTEDNELRLFASSAGDIPLLTISGQGPTGESAIRLVDAAANAIADYVSEIQESQDIPEYARVQIRRLGPPQGGLVNEGVDKMAAALAFVGGFVGWCILVLLAGRIGESWREVRAAGNVPWAPEPAAAETSTNGASEPAAEDPAELDEART
jgi:hypothetical protein